MTRGGAEREGDAESEAGSRPWAISAGPNTGLKPAKHEIMTWAKVRHSTGWAPQAPLRVTFSIYFAETIHMHLAAYPNVGQPFGLTYILWNTHHIVGTNTKIPEAHVKRLSFVYETPSQCGIGVYRLQIEPKASVSNESSQIYI